MYISIDNEKRIERISSTYFENAIEYNGEIDYEKTVFAKYENGVITYDENKYNQAKKEREEYVRKIEEIKKLEQWFTDYDRMCNEHARCQRLGTDCHHNIEELDAQAVANAKKLKELRVDVNSNTNEV